jgi:hypothetical protein
MKLPKKNKEEDMICSQSNNRTKLCTFEKCAQFKECFEVKNGK